MPRRARSLERFDPEIEATARRLNAKRLRRVRGKQEHMANNANRSFGQMGAPTLTKTSIPCILKPDFGTKNFELKPHLIQMIERNQFGGHSSESPHDYLTDFIERCDTITAKDLSMEAVRMRLFPSSLKDKAKSWLKSEPAGIYRTWESLANGFLAKFYPPRKTSQIRTQLQTFKQQPFESFYEAWERFKDLQLSCPHHEIPNWLLTQSFYGGLFDEHKSSINATCGGDMDSKIPVDLLKLFETMAKNGHSWSNERGPVAQANIAESETIKALTKQIANLTEQVAKVSMVSSSSSNSNANNSSMVCDTCGAPGHCSSSCPQVYEETNALYGKPNGNPHPNQYNAGHKHPNLSYTSTNVLNPQHIQPPFQQPPPYKQYAQPTPPNLRTEVDDLKVIVRNHIQNSVTHMKFLETQLAQIAHQISTRAPNQLLSQPEPKNKEPNQINSMIKVEGNQLSDLPLQEVSHMPRSSPRIAKNHQFPETMRRVVAL
jgi:retrotransposon gag protein